MKTITLLFVLASCLASVGCLKRGHSKEVNTFISERGEVLGQMLDKIDASPNEAGINEARKIFDARKADLKAKRDAMPRGTNLSSDDLLELVKSDNFNLNLWIALDQKIREKNDKLGFAEKEALVNKAGELEKDFDSTFK
jgi:hypothetical protein